VQLGVRAPARQSGEQRGAERRRDQGVAREVRRGPRRPDLRGLGGAQRRGRGFGESLDVVAFEPEQSGLAHGSQFQVGGDAVE